MSLDDLDDLDDDGPIVLLDDSWEFPPPELTRPDGLLAVGGDLAPGRLLAAYRNGIFPWYEPPEPVLWWCPDPRLVLEPAGVRVSRGLRATIRKGIYTTTFDTAFRQVMRGCATSPRREGPGTWISPEVEAGYGALHDLGLAHSVETWHEGELAGGLYGVLLGRTFFGESMFTRRTDASKVAFVALCSRLARLGVDMIDCQVETPHLSSLGARSIPRSEFLARLRDGLRDSIPPGKWNGPEEGRPGSGSG